MADYNITVTVPSSATGTWYFSVNQGANQTGCINLANVPEGEEKSFALTLQPATAGATVAFNPLQPTPPTPPALQFFNWKGQVLTNPMWYSPELTTNNTVLTFTDDSLNAKKRTYYFKINATYNGTQVTSPDPTIINAGTGGTSPIYGEEHEEVRESEAAV
jgi:hypothetical protein